MNCKTKRQGPVRVVALHTDFRIYWPARWKHLAQRLKETGTGELEVVEIFGKGSPYAFNETWPDEELQWHILFPEASPEQIGGREIKPGLFRLLDRIDPDVIISGAIAYPSGALAVQWALARKNKRVVCFDDAKRNAVVRSRIVDFVKQCVYDGVDAMFYPADTWRQTGESWGFKDSEMFFGVDVVDNAFWQHPSETPVLDAPYMLAAGRLIPKKNFTGVVNAYGIYAHNVGKDRAIPLVIVGEGPEWENIERRIEHCGVEENVTIMPFQSQKRLRNIMQYAELLMLLSNEAETWGLVINEAMNCGCAVVASRQCGATDVLVADGKNGFVTDFSDTALTAACLEKYHHLTQNEKRGMADCSKSRIDQWGLDRFAEGAMAALKSVMARPKRNPGLLGKVIIRLWNGRYNPV